MIERSEKESFIIANYIRTNKQIKLNEDFINKTPYIVPTDIKLEIVSFLSDRNWKSLFYVNKDWRYFVISVMDSYLDSVSDKIDLIKFFDISPLITNLFTEVEKYSINSQGARSSQVEALMKLATEIPNLNNPLAKLFHFQNTISQIQKAIEESYDRTTHYIFNNPYKSQLYCILTTFSGMYFKSDWPLQEIWFKNLMFCAEFSANHPTTKLFSEAFLEIKKLKDSSLNTEIKNTQNNDQQKPLFRSFFNKGSAQKPFENTSNESKNSELKNF